MLYWFDRVVVFRIAVPSEDVFSFAVLDDVPYDVIYDVLSRTGVTLI